MNLMRIYSPRAFQSLIALSLAATPALAEQADGPVPSITVDGEATASIVPDTAVITLGVITERPRATEAAAESARAVQAVIDAIRAEGIDPLEVQTVSVNLSPVSEQPPEGVPTPGATQIWASARLAPARPESAPKVRAFQAVNELQVRVTPVDKAAPLVAKLVDKGVNLVTGVQFASGAETGLCDRLRAGAIEDARRKAQISAAALGIKIGRVLKIGPERCGFRGVPDLVGKLQVQRAAAPIPVEAGQRTTQAIAYVTWELLQ